MVDDGLECNRVMFLSTEMSALVPLASIDNHLSAGKGLKYLSVIFAKPSSKLCEVLTEDLLMSLAVFMLDFCSKTLGDSTKPNHMKSCVDDCKLYAP